MTKTYQTRGGVDSIGLENIRHRKYTPLIDISLDIF